MVALILVSFIRSVCPGCSLAFASCALFARVRLRWGLERMTGLEPATSTLAWWYSTRLSYIRMSRRPLPAREVGACNLPIDLAYECGRVVCVLSTHGVVVSVA